MLTVGRGRGGRKPTIEQSLVDRIESRAAAAAAGRIKFKTPNPIPYPDPPSSSSSSSQQLFSQQNNARTTKNFRNFGQRIYFNFLPGFFLFSFLSSRFPDWITVYDSALGLNSKQGARSGWYGLCKKFVEKYGSYEANESFRS